MGVVTPRNRRESLTYQRVQGKSPLQRTCDGIRVGDRVGQGQGLGIGLDSVSCGWVGGLFEMRDAIGPLTFCIGSLEPPSELEDRSADAPLRTKSGLRQTQSIGHRRTRGRPPSLPTPYHGPPLPESRPLAPINQSPPLTGLNLAPARHPASIQTPTPLTHLGARADPAAAAAPMPAG